MFRRKRDIPEEFDREEYDRYSDMTDDQLARVFDRSNPREQETIFAVFRKRTGQKLKS